MNELNRQFAIFGDFNGISLENIIENLQDVIEKYNFLPGLAQSSPIPGGAPENRPALYSSDGNEYVVFETTKIYIQQDNVDTEGYDKFMEKSLDVITRICTVFDFKIKRLACNGAIISQNPDDAKTKYGYIFNKDSVFYDDESMEWDFSTNKKHNEPAINSVVNQITRATGSNAIILSNGITAPCAFSIIYDYNTDVDHAEDFSLDALPVFAELATKYRKETIEA